MLEDIDCDKYGEKLPIHVAQYRATKIYGDILKECSITGQAQILRCLLVSKTLEDAMSLLGIHKVTKEWKLKHNVIENIGDAIKKFGKSRKKDTSATCRAIQTAIVSASTRQKRLTTQLEQAIGTSKKTLYKHRKFREKDTSVARRAIQTAIVSSSIRKKRLTTQLAQEIGTSRKTLYKHSKFRMQIDENDELVCWKLFVDNLTKIEWEKC